MKVRRNIVEEYSPLKTRQSVSGSFSDRVLSDVDVFEDLEDQLFVLASDFISEAAGFEKVINSDYTTIDDLISSISSAIKGKDNKSAFKKQSDRVVDGYVRNYGTRLDGGW